jgi:hypothetical protein
VGRLEIYARFSGSGYLRILPLNLIETVMRREARAGHSTVVYLHPRDLSSDVPRIAMPIGQRFRKYARLAGTRDKVATLLRRNEFACCHDLLVGTA